MKSFRKSVRAHTFGVILAFAIPAAFAADEAGRFGAIIDAAIRPLMARYDIPGMAVALTIDGQSFVHTYGVTSRHSQIPVSTSTLFEIGSISKIFTTTLAAYAHVTGRLSLSEGPGRYLTPLQGRPIDQVTLLHLGTYTAGGLPLQFPDEIRDEVAAIDYFRTWQPHAPPGTVREYSNPSIGLLGLVTTGAMQGNFANLLDTLLLSRLGMQHTYIHLPPASMSDYAWGERNGKQVRVNSGPLDSETYGIKSTATDMIRFVDANIDPGRLAAPLRQAIEITQMERFSVGDMVQGFGWEQYPYPVSRKQLLAGNSAEIIFDRQSVRPVVPQPRATPRLFNKTGSTSGFGAYVVFVPARRIGLVMLANRNYPIPARVETAHAILRHLAPTP